MALQKFETITPAQLAAKGVRALPNRPNVPGTYGGAGLSAEQLKAWFDNLAMLLADRVNAISNTLASDSAGNYIRMPLSAQSYNFYTLTEFMDAFHTGRVAELLHVYPSVSADCIQTLQAVINGIAKMLSEHAENIKQNADDVASRAARIEIRTVSNAELEFCLINEAGERISWQRLDMTVYDNLIENGAVTTPKLRDSCVVTDKIADAAVTTEKLADKSVSGPKMAAGSVGSDKLALELSNRILQLERHAVTGVQYDAATGQFSFSTKEGNTLVDLPMELIATGGYYDGTDGAEAIVLKLANEEEIRIPVAGMMSELMHYMDGIREKIYDLQEAPPLAALSDSVLLCTPTLAQLAALG